MQILQMLKVLFTHNSEVKDMFCGDSTGSELSLFFRDNLLSFGYEAFQYDF